MLRKSKKLICFSLLVSLCFPITVNAKSDNFTIQDLRKIVGREKEVKVFTQDEIEEITKGYKEIEENNAYAKLYEESNKEIEEINKEQKEKMEKLNKEVDGLVTELQKAFKSGCTLDIVLQKRTQCNAKLTERAKLRQKQESIVYEYKENIWEKKYKQVQKYLKYTRNDFVIGCLGTTLKVPLSNHMFTLLRPYGEYYNSTKTKIYTLKGIDLKANENEKVLAQFHGVVEVIEKKKDVGYTIKIRHGSDLYTVYEYLSDISVKVGDVVTQYQEVGVVGKIGKSATNSGVRFKVVLDNKALDPLYLYGEKGLNAIRVFASTNPMYYKINEKVNRLEKKISKAIKNENIGVDDEILDNDIRVPLTQEELLDTSIIQATLITPIPEESARESGVMENEE